MLFLLKGHLLLKHAKEKENKYSSQDKQTGLQIDIRYTVK